MMRTVEPEYIAMADLDAVNVLAELERCGQKFEWSTQDEVKVRCPFHPDDSPSCHINIRKRVFNCPVAGCHADGDFVSYLARLLKTSRAIVLTDLATRYPIEQAKLIDPALVERYHAAIWSALPLLKELYIRGLTDEDIREFRLGEDGGRIQIPIPNAAGHFVNLRKYLPGAPGKEKMRNTKGHGEVRWFPASQLKYNRILVVGGECKAIVAKRQLNRHGIGCVTATSGEGNLSNAMVKELEGKTVWVCLDIDAAGIKAARQHALQISRVAAWIGQPILLPLDIEKYPKGDINDYVGPENNGQLLPLLEVAQEFVPELSAVYDDDSPPESMELTQAIHARVAGKRIAVKAVISTMDTSPYIVPNELQIICERDQKFCSVCPVSLDDKNEYAIAAESPHILELVNSHKGQQLEVVKSAVGIPRICKACDFLPLSHYNVEDARISPQLEITNRSADRVMQPAFCIGDGLELNESYDLTGRMFPHPKTQQSTLLISKYNTTQDALSTYKCDHLEALGQFWPDEWSASAIQRKLDDVYADFEANVTRIFQRRDLHLSVDLAYHSPLFFPFDGKTIKGWVETLILGDSSQGKSEVACGTTGNGGLLAHYNLGTKVECKNATVAGLLGGLQQLGGRFFVSWGIIPTHDKRLVILEELKGAQTEVIGKLTDMRSSGIAEIPKIEKRRTHARTRLIAISNPRSDMRLSQYNFGIEAIKELVGGLEDVRRFDFSMLVSSTEIDVEQLNILQKSRPQVNHNHTGDLCRSLILWAWTRSKNEVVFDDEATALILSEATKLCDMFTDAIPLIDRGSMRYKLARLSASIAARTFSCSEDFTTLIVYPCHVEYIVNFLRRIYSSNVFGYLDYTKAINISQSLIDPEQIQKAISCSPYPADLIKQLIAKNRIDVQDLCDWCGWDRPEATELLSVFVRKHALIRDGKHYRKTAKFIVMLKDLLERGGFTDKPPHLRKEY